MTSQNYQEVLNLISAIQTELCLYDTGKADSVKLDDYYVPSYLHPIHENRKREIVRKCLKELAKLIHINNSFDNNDLHLVIVAILYSEREQSALWEYKSANSFYVKFKKDCSETKFKLSISDDNKKLINILIQYHKIASSVIGNRLPQTIYDHISTLKELTKKSLMGLMAVACYDIPGESGAEDKHIDNRKYIMDSWTGTYQSSDPKKLENTIILYDLPICEKNEDSGWSRTGFKHELLTNFLEFKAEANLTKQEGDDYLYLTFNYNQSRFDIITCDDLEKIKEKYEFVTLVKENDLLPLVYELRLKQANVPSIILNLEDKSPEDKSNFDLQFIKTIVTNKYSYKDKDSGIFYYPIPLSNYLPLPLLVKYFKLLHEYSEKVIVKGIPITMQEITYKFWGQLDDKIPGHFEIYVPDYEESKKSSIEPIVKRLLAAYATNIGICVGYDRIQLEGDNTSWVKQASELLKHEECGFELLIRYIECFMRSHDVNVSDENLVETKSYHNELKALLKNNYSDKKSIGIDIGGTSIKYRLCDSNGQPLESYKTSTRKNPTNKDEKYETIKKFAERLKKGLEALLKRYNKANNINPITLKHVDVIGISWPGAIREQKIAGASGILGYFEEEIASNYIRKNAVEKIRKIDLISDLKGVLGKDGKNITIGICNDGYAEALGRIFLKDSPYRNNKWAILKFGTGTAGSIITDGKINDGITEFGKLVINMYLKKHDEEQYQINISHKLLTEKEPKQSTPKGLINNYSSQNLLPTIFGDILKSSFKISSFEVGTLANYFLGENINIDNVIKELGIESLYLEKLEHITDKKKLSDVYHNTTIDYEEINPILEATGLKSIEAIKDECDDRGANRILEILLEITNSGKYDKINTVKFQMVATINRKSFAEGILKKLTNSQKGAFTVIFKEIYDKAGSIFADVIMLIREYYKFNGVIICGGVIQDNIPTKHMLRSTKLHLKKKYWIDFKGIDKYENEKAFVRKQSHRTIYHNFLDNFSDTTPNDQGEVGALYHAKIIKAAMGKKNKNV